jgi:uncharacterized protein YicC (UPF0701 family)
LEALKTELEDSLDTTAAVQDLRNKRENELQDLKKTLETSQQQYEVQVQDVRQKYTVQLEAVNEELENARKVCVQLSFSCKVFYRILIYYSGIHLTLDNISLKKETKRFFFV